MGGEKGGAWWIIILFLGSPPRGRGKALLLLDAGVVVGITPHGRGKGRRSQPQSPPSGITPAQAGKSLFCFTAAVPIQDHPRVGGEKLTLV